MPEHGGNLAAAIRRWGIPREQWLDLSTGINPHPWPAPPLPTTILHRLPEEDDGLEEAARCYYGAEQVLPVPGSQAAIALLPRFRSRSRVGIVAPTYAEHEHHWRLAGHDVRCLSLDEVDSELDELEVLVLVRPNNPDGTCLSRSRVLDWWRELRERGGWLIVDEAFVDPEPDDSLADFARNAGFIVLRSFGKFFGLPGIRLGFVLADEDLLQKLRAGQGPWPVSSPARYWGALALADSHWQRATRARLQRSAERLKNLLDNSGLSPRGSTRLFQFVPHSDAEAIQEAFASLGILVRLWLATDAGGPALRFGLPGAESDWRKLESALNIIMGE